MPYDPTKHHRRSIRLRRYDYTQPGAYFVTIRTRDGHPLFGGIVDGQTVLNPVGQAVQSIWEEIPKHHPGVNVDAFVVMPNHIHGIIVIHDVRARHAVPVRPAVPLRESFGKSVPRSLPTIVRSFKSAATKRINGMRDTPGAVVWQRDYFERVIRDEEELNHIRQYIIDNPQNWAHDIENPDFSPSADANAPS